MTNEEKAREIANNNCTHICMEDCSAESYFSSENDCYKSALEAMQWKDNGNKEVSVFDILGIKRKKPITNLLKHNIMATLINFNIKEDQLSRMADDIDNGYLSITVELRDEPSRFGKNAAITNGKKGADKVYYCNGRVVWTDGKVTVAPKPEQPQAEPQADFINDLPF